MADDEIKSELRTNKTAQASAAPFGFWIKASPPGRKECSAFGQGMRRPPYCFCSEKKNRA